MKIGHIRLGGGANEWTGCFNMVYRPVNKDLRSTCTFTNMIYWKSEIGKVSSDGIRLSIFGYGNTLIIQTHIPDGWGNSVQGV